MLTATYFYAMRYAAVLAIAKHHSNRAQAI